MSWCPLNTPAGGGNNVLVVKWTWDGFLRGGFSAGFWTTRKWQQILSWSESVAHQSKGDWEWDYVVEQEKSRVCLSVFLSPELRLWILHFSFYTVKQTFLTARSRKEWIALSCWFSERVNRFMCFCSVAQVPHWGELYVSTDREHQAVSVEQKRVQHSQYGQSGWNHFQFHQHAL